MSHPAEVTAALAGSLRHPGRSRDIGADPPAHQPAAQMQRLPAPRAADKVWPNIYSQGDPDAPTDCVVSTCAVEKRSRSAWAPPLPYTDSTPRTSPICMFSTRSATSCAALTGLGGPSPRRRPADDAARTPADSTGMDGDRGGRGLPRPRALATLDAALRSDTCDRRDLLLAAKAAGRPRGIVDVRDLVPLARPEAESPMESEARLVMHDGGLPEPVLQYDHRRS